MHRGKETYIYAERLTRTLQRGEGGSVWRSLTVWSLTLAAGGLVVPVSGEAAFAVAPACSWAALAAVCQGVAGDAQGGWATLTPPAALAAGEPRLALLQGSTNKHSSSSTVVSMLAIFYIHYLHVVI